MKILKVKQIRKCMDGRKEERKVHKGRKCGRKEERRIGSANDLEIRRY